MRKGFWKMEHKTLEIFKMNTPASEFEAFAWIASNCEFEGPDAGKLRMSERSLALKFSWTRKKVQVFIEKLERHQLGHQVRDQLGHHLSLVNSGSNPTLGATLGTDEGPRRDQEANLSLLPKKKNKKEELNTLPIVVKNPPGFRVGTDHGTQNPHVYLSKDELISLVNEFGKESVLAKIISLDASIENGVRKYLSYKNHYKTVRAWLVSDVAKRPIEHIHKYESKTEQAERDIDRQMSDARNWAQEEIC